MYKCWKEWEFNTLEYSYHTYTTNNREPAKILILDGKCVLKCIFANIMYLEGSARGRIANFKSVLWRDFLHDSLEIKQAFPIQVALLLLKMGTVCPLKPLAYS